MTAAARAAVAAARRRARGWPFRETDPAALSWRPPRRPAPPAWRGTPPPAVTGPSLPAALTVIDRRNADLGAFVLVDRTPAGSGPLLGVKDVLDVAGLPTGAGSRAYHRPAMTDAPAVGRLRRHGWRVLGKTETHEFALGVTTPQSANPHDPARIAGGSSGGSAIAVATGMCAGSLGTDTRASIRVPSALCGVVGLKPTLGAVPTVGVVTLSWSMDHVGPITATVGDAALMLDQLTGATTAAAWRAPIDGRRIGLLEHAVDSADADVAVAVAAGCRRLEQAGAEVIAVGTPPAAMLDDANAAGLLISRAEAAAFHEARGTALSACTPETSGQLTAAASVTAGEYVAAQRLRARLASELLEAAIIDQLDAWLLPTTPCVAPPRSAADRQLIRLCQNVILWSLIGFPALSVPAPDVSGLPIGLQLTACPGEDATLVAIGSHLEAATSPTARPYEQKGTP